MANQNLDVMILTFHQNRCVIGSRNVCHKILRSIHIQIMIEIIILLWSPLVELIFFKVGLK